MKYVRPWATTTSERRHIVSSLTSLRGSSIRAIHYLVPTPLIGEVWSYEGFDVVPGGVAIEADPASICVIWRMDDQLGEGLEVILGDDYRTFAADEELEVSPRIEHAPLTELTVEEIGVAWHDVDQSRSLQAMWSFRLSSATAHVTFALGTVDVDSSELTYQPDSVAVIYDESKARQYRPPASTMAAWGVDI